MTRLEDFFPRSNNKKFSPVKIRIDNDGTGANLHVIYVDTNVNSKKNAYQSLRVQETCKNPEQRVIQIASDLMSKGYLIQD